MASVFVCVSDCVSETFALNCPASVLGCTVLLELALTPRKLSKDALAVLSWSALPPLTEPVRNVSDANVTAPISFIATLRLLSKR